ncbi:small hydrophobic protein [Actinacidiphila alni]|uniref:small hydrophobic protein n=1 Tax=Actinacidiphila alni TaxID=380248 RepID=UPI0034570999
MARRSSVLARRGGGRVDYGTRRTDIGTLNVVGVVCALAGFFVLGILLGPVAMVCGWLGMGRRWSGRKPVLAVVALILGAIDTLIALLYLAQ